MDLITRTETRTYEIQVDLDGDDVLETVTVEETYTVTELDGDAETLTDTEALFAMDTGATTRTATATLSGSDEVVTLELDGTYASPAFTPDSAALVSELELTGAGELLDQVSTFEPIAPTGPVGVPGAFDDVLISQQSLRGEDDDWSNFCGPTALLMTLARHGVWDGEVDGAAISTLADDLQTGDQGTRYTNVIAYAEGAGLEVDNLNDGTIMGWDDFYGRLFASLEAGEPVMLSVGFAAFEEQTGGATTHYVIVTGYDDGQFTVVDPWTGTERTVSWQTLHDGVQGRQDVLGPNAMPWSSDYYMLTFSPAD